MEDIKETLSNKDYKDKVGVEIKSFDDTCQMLYQVSFKTWLYILHITKFF